MQKENLIVSEKIVRRIMREENLVAAVKQRRKYNSYKGEISPSVPITVQPLSIICWKKRLQNYLKMSTP